MVIQWLSWPHRPGFYAQTVYSFLVLVHLIKVVRLRILVQEEGGQRVYVGNRYPLTLPLPMSLPLTSKIVWH